MLTSADEVANECICQLMPLPMQLMPLNASVDEEYACADEEDADVCRCKRCGCLPMHKISMSTDAKDDDVCLYQPMLMMLTSPDADADADAEAVSNADGDYVCRCSCQQIPLPLLMSADAVAN